ncbi:MAG: ABC transporter substrate-binding protein [Candidatus Hydrogenedentes bacterium]|nr:ABC transporter substrate-binding protein [Candidatus Hydrogenedentota bacterium]
MFKPLLRTVCPCVCLVPLLAAILSACGGASGGKGIVSLAPNLTETIFALGEGDRLVGVSDFDDYPVAVKNLPRVGGYIDPDLEQLSLLSPALIIVPGQHEQVTSFGEMNQIPVLNVHMDNLETIHAGIDTIGATLGVPAKAAELRARIDADLDALRGALKPHPRKKVLIVLGRERGDLTNLQTVGGSSFISELVEAAGGDNIYKSAAQPYLEASKETILLEAPDAILEIQAGKSLTTNQTQALYNDWRFMDTVPAVKNGAIYYVTESHAMRPGPRIADVAKIIARKLYFEAELPE